MRTTLSLILFALLTTICRASSLSGGGGSATAAPYGPGNPYKYTNLPQVTSNGSTLVYYWTADDLPSQSAGSSIATGTIWTDEISGAAITLTSSGVAETYELGTLGNHACIRFPGNATAAGAFSSSITWIDQNMCLLAGAEDVFQPNAIGSLQPALLFSLGSSNQIRYGMAVTTTLDQMCLGKNANPTLTNTFNTEYFGSFPQLIGWSQATTVSTAFMDNQAQVVNGIFTSTPVTTTGGTMGTFNSSGQQDGFDCYFIAVYNGPVPYAPVTGVNGGTAGYQNVQQAIAQGYSGMGISRPNRVFAYTDSVFRGFSTNSSGAGNPWSPLNWMQKYLGNNWACYNGGVDGAQTTDLLGSFGAITAAMKGNTFANNILLLQIGNNDIAASASAATIENNIQSLGQQGVLAGFNYVELTTVINGGYSGAQSVVWAGVNTWITGTWPTLNPAFFYMDIANNAGVTGSIFSAPHLKGPGLQAAGYQCAVSIQGLAPSTYPGVIAKLTLSSGTAATTFTNGLTSSMQFVAQNVLPSGTQTGASVSLTGSPVSIMTVTGAVTDNGTYLVYRKF